MNIAIIYATNSGSTYEAGKAIKEALEKAGHSLIFITAAEASSKNILDVDLVLLGSPTWFANGTHGQLQETMAEFLDRIKGKIPSGKKFACFGCGDRDFTLFCKAVDRMEEFALSEGGVIVLPGLKLENFFFKLEENYKIIEIWVESLKNKL